MNKIQLIIPACQDREALLLLLPDLIAKGWTAHQITVVDADPEPPPSFPINWITAPPERKGRAKQMNLGAAQSNADIFLFLHADTRLPESAADQIQQALSSGYIGGGFSRRFDSPSWFLRFTCCMADLRGKFFGWFFGDQCIFCSREAFEHLGGYPEIFPFEDLEFSRKLKKIGRLKLIRPGILTSARRFEKEGPFRQTVKDVALTLSYLKNKEPLYEKQFKNGE